MKEQQPGEKFKDFTAFVEKGRELRDKYEIGVEEAIFSPQPDYPNLPIALVMMSDTHYGSLNTNHSLLAEHLQAIEDTPNFYIAHNGDHIDNFNAMFFQSGQFENPMKPQFQTEAWMDKMKQLGEKGKIAVMSFGNHDQFMEGSGYDWLQTFGKDIKAPIFDAGGLLHVKHGQEHYKVALTHMYWGRSKLNPTNAPKRFWEHEYPEADVAYLGHTHQSEILHGERGGKERIWGISGTYKDRDDWARQRGIGGRSGAPGHTILFYPDSHKMVGFKHLEDAQQHMLGMVWQEHHGKSQ
jgi:predicted phosphodiesterase